MPAPTTTAPATDSTRSSRKARGFTLVELMVTMTGTLIVSITLFSLARFTSKIYQGESRMSNATLGNVIGFERLRADIVRAGAMASPHVRRDPFVCGNPTAAGWPAQLANLTSIQIQNTDVTTLPDLFADNNLQPQSITLAGNFLTTAGLSVDQITLVGATYQVLLQGNQRGLAELGYMAAGADRQAILGSVFPTGRAVRIVDDAGRHHYGQITGVSTLNGPAVVLSANAPALQNGDGGALGCGLDIGSDGLVSTEINPVQFIRYRIGSLLGDARFAPIYAAAGPTYDGDRTELIREELDVAGVVIDGTAELVAEYAVDLHFGLTVAPTPATNLLYVPRNAVAGWAGSPAAAGGIAAGQGPQLIRAVHATLSIRSLEADRQADIPTPAAQARYRVGLGDNGGAPFARVRTSQARIFVPNHERANWR